MFPFALCYACYAAAFMLEIFRLGAHDRKVFYAHNAGVYPAIAGFIVHSYLLCQQHIVAVHPLNGPTMFFLVSAWGLVLIYIIWSYYYPHIPFGIVLLPIVLVLTGTGYKSVTVIETIEPSSRSVAKMLHAAPAAGTMIALSIACTCCLFYLLESYLLRNKRPFSPLLKLPSLEWSLSVFRISCAVAIGFLCLCALGGVLLNIHRDNMMSVWRDPIIVGTSCLLLILLFGSLKWLFRSPRTTENRFVFMLVMTVFLTFLFLLVIVFVSSNAHWNKPRAVGSSFYDDVPQSSLYAQRH